MTVASLALSRSLEALHRHARASNVAATLVQVDRVTNGTDKTWVSEYRFLRRDGHALTVIDRGSVIRNDSGRAIRMVGMLDVSPRRDLEACLRQAQKPEAIGQLTGGIARRPITPGQYVVLTVSDTGHGTAESRQCAVGP